VPGFRFAREPLQTQDQECDADDDCRVEYVEDHGFIPLPLLDQTGSKEFVRSSKGLCAGRVRGFCRVVIFRQRKRAHPVRGKDRSPPGFHNSISRTDFLPVICGPRAHERKFDMPVKCLPAKPSLDHLKYQAKDLRKGHEARDSAVAQRIREFHPRFARASDAEIFAASFSLSDAQLTIARESGFSSWSRLKRHIEKPTLADRLDLPHHERIEDAELRRAVHLLDAGDVAGLREYLKQHPDVVHQRALFEGGNYFQNPTLLEFAAENPTRQGKLPANIVDVVRVIVEAGASQTALNVTLALAATGSVAQESRLQVPLIDLLCAHGADPNSAVRAAALHGGLESMNALLRHGAAVDLVVAATLGRFEDVRRLLPDANSQDKQLALSQAAQLGYVEIVRLLLDAGADPNRYNPVGHSHTTPLHQAAAYGPEHIVRLFVERGARVDVKDILWQGTAADWAGHVGRKKIESYLRSKEIKSDP